MRPERLHVDPESHQGRNITRSSDGPTGNSFMTRHSLDPLRGDGFSHTNRRSSSSSEPSPSRGGSYQDFLRRKKQQELAESTLPVGHRPIVGGAGATPMGSVRRSGASVQLNQRFSTHGAANNAPEHNRRTGSYPRHNVPLGFAPRPTSGFPSL